MSPHREIMEPGLRRRPYVASHRRIGPVGLLVRTFLGAMTMVALPAVIGWWVLASPRFLVAEVEVRGVGKVSSEWIFDQMEPLEGRHLLSLPLAAVERRLLEHPWIEGVDVRRHLPNRLVVGVREREPAILLRSGVDLFYVDRHGVLIEEYDPEGSVDLILLRTADDSLLDVEEVLGVVADLSRAVPDWGAGISELEALGAGDYRIQLAALFFPVLVSAERVEGPVRSLHKFLPQIARRFDRLQAVDLRFSNQIVIQPFGALPTQEG